MKKMILGLSLVVMIFGMVAVTYAQMVSLCTTNCTGGGDCQEKTWQDSYEQDHGEWLCYTFATCPHRTLSIRKGRC